MIIVRSEKILKKNDILLFFDTEKGKLFVQKYNGNSMQEKKVKNEINKFMDEYGYEKNTKLKIIENVPVEGAYSAPVKLFIDITDECNLKCKHCLDEHLNSNNYLDVDTIKMIADECSKLGIFNVKLGGGEPLLHPDFFEIVHIFREKDIFLSMSSNGYFVNAEVAKSLAENKVRTTISIEGSEKIDSLIRGEGHFAVAVKALRLLKQYGVNVSFRVTFTKYCLSIEMLEELKDLAKAENVKVKFAYCKPSGAALERKLIVDMNDHKEYIKAMKFLNEEENQKYFIIENGMKINQDKFYDDLYLGGRGCGAGNRTMHIDASGIVSSCVFLRTWYNSSFRYGPNGIEKFWRNEKNESGNNLEVIRNTEFPKECFTCKRNCNGQCKALRLYSSGSLTGLNPNCIR